MSVLIPTVSKLVIAAQAGIQCFCFAFRIDGKSQVAGFSPKACGNGESEWLHRLSLAGTRG